MIEWERIAQINIPWFGYHLDTGSCNCRCPSFFCNFQVTHVTVLRLRFYSIFFIFLLFLLSIYGIIRKIKRSDVETVTTVTSQYIQGFSSVTFNRNRSVTQPKQSGLLAEVHNNHIAYAFFDSFFRLYLSSSNRVLILSIIFTLSMASSFRNSWTTVLASCP